MVMLLMLAGGIGLVQTASDPNAVTLRWLRLGGLIAVTLLVVAGVATMANEGVTQHLGLIGICLVPYLIQLTTSQLDKRRLQRVAAGVGYVMCAGVTAWLILMTLDRDPFATDYQFHPMDLMAIILAALACGLVGGYVMTMLLGHAYLTADSEMTQSPFKRMVLLLAGLLLARAAVAVGFGLVPYLGAEQAAAGRIWTAMMVTSRMLVGLVVPLIFTYMIYDCVKRRSNQSATGILYVATVLVLIGEGCALALMDATKLLF